MNETVTRPKAIMLVGLPGSGKSTIHRTHDPEGNYHRYSTDDELEAIAIQRGQTYSDVFIDFYSEAQKTANAKLDDAKERQVGILFDQTNLTTTKRKATLKNLPDIYYKIGLVLLPPATMGEMMLLKERLVNRPNKHIPWGIIVSMMDTFDMPTITEGFDEVGFYNAFQHDPSMIAEHGERTNIDVIFDAFQFSKIFIKELSE